MIWSELRSTVLRTILNDTNGAKYQNPVLLDCCAWALDRFVTHTAVVSSVEIPASTTQFTLPDNVFEPIDVASTMYSVVDSEYLYYAPREYTEETNIPAERQYYIVGSSLRFLTAPTSTVTLEYYAYYNVPVVDSDTVAIPRWSRMAVSYLIAAYAQLNDMTGNVAARANPAKAIDMGSPEDSGYRTQYQFLVSQYDKELQRYTPQSRLLYRGDI